MELAKKQITPPPAPNYFTMKTEDILQFMEKPETISSSLMEGISYAELEQPRDEMEQLEFDGLQNLAGFIAFKLRGKEQLGEITSQQSEEMRSHQTWTDFLSEGGLMKPYAHLVKACDELNKVFIEFNGNTLKAGVGYIKSMMLLSQHVETSDEVKTLVLRCRMYFKIRILNQERKQATTLKKMNKIIN